MIALLQRVLSASVAVKDKTIAEMDKGILVFLGIQPEDDETKADKLLSRLLHYRLFEDNHGKMNLSVQDCDGSILIVSQFTLAADTTSGLRPGFSTAASPAHAKRLYDYFIDRAKAQYHAVKTGEFGAYMKVSLCNDGPVTLTLHA